VTESRSPARFRVLISNDEILRRSRELARRIRQDYGSELPMLVAVIEGARTFARQLQQTLGAGPVHEIRASSYGNATRSSGKVQITAIRDFDVRGRDVLLIEDIVDTGRTVAALNDYCRVNGARDCRVVTLLAKPSRRVIEVELHYVGFEIPDEFVIGFGMDYAGRYRELPDVVVYDGESVQAAQQ